MPQSAAARSGRGSPFHSLGVRSRTCTSTVFKIPEAMNANHIRNLAQATLSGSMPFPEIVEKLIAEGVEYYHIDYASLQMIFYSEEGSIVIAPLTLVGNPAVAKDFNASALKSAIYDSQHNEQKFREFSRRAAEAGVAGYFAFLRGKRVIYLGRQGSHHVEWFPGVNPTDA